MFERTESLPLELPREGTLRPRRPNIERSHSEIAATIRPSYKSPTGPPDITAYDLSDDQLQRTYSQTDVWDSKKDRMPPLQPMTGFGKYRRSVHADAEWQMQRYRASLCDLPLMVRQLGDFGLAGIDPEVWEQVQRDSARSNSFASSRTSHSASSGCPNESKPGPQAGTLVSRGFVPSNPSSPASSFRDSNGHARKDSGLSMTSPEEPGSKSVRYPSRQSTLAVLGGPTALTSINEDLAGNYRQKRPSQFLQCDSDDDTENALASDDDQDEKAAVMVDDPNKVHKHAELTYRSKTCKRGTLAQKTAVECAKENETTVDDVRQAKRAIDRANTVIKRPLKSGLRRATSRGKVHGLKRNVPTENISFTSKKSQAATIIAAHGISETHCSADGSGEAHEKFSDSPPLYMADVNPARRLSLKVKEDSASSWTSELTETTTVAQMTRKPTDLAAQGRRNRSATAFRVVSEISQGDKRQKEDEKKKTRVITD